MFEVSTVIIVALLLVIVWMAVKLRLYARDVTELERTLELMTERMEVYRDTMVEYEKTIREYRRVCSGMQDAIDGRHDSLEVKS